MKLLDDAEERTILLLAPAGYGKTTLARQWAKTLNSSIWITLTPAHRDVATLAEDLAAGIDARGDASRTFIEEYLRGQTNPQRVARDVGLALAEQLEISRVQWLVLDDYHELTGDPENEDVIRLIRERSSIRILVATRVRPSWATPRNVLYGDVFEIDRAGLAMTPDESRSLIDEPRLESLFESAHGWPALLALAQGLDTDADFDPNALPSTLHDYVAGELFDSAEPCLQEQLLALALLPDFSVEALSCEFGNDAGHVLDRARDLGFLGGESGSELHPLLREFLLTKLTQAPDGTRRARDAVTWCVELSKWDEALALAQRFGLTDVLRPILAKAYKPLLRRGRIGTLSRLGEVLRTATGVNEVESDLVDAEVALRDGEYRLARQIIHRVRGQVDESHPLRARAAAIDGAAAFQLAEYDASERAYEEALAEAHDDLDVAEAQHGLVLAAVYGERPTADQRVQDMSLRASQTGSPLDVARHAASALARMRIGSGFGDSPHIQDATRVLPHVEDPRARTSVMVTLAYCLGLQADYTAALEVAQQMLTEVEAYGLEFARPHGDWNVAFAQLGLRRFGEADRSLQRIEDALDQRHLTHHLLNARVLRARLLMQLARHDEAYELVRHPVNDGAAPSMHAEYVVMRALALALMGKSHAAVEQAGVATGMSVSCDVRLFAIGVKSIVAAEQGDPVGAARIIEAARETHLWDPVVACVRSSQTLATVLGSSEAVRADLEWLYKRSNDFGLARKAGLRSRNARLPQNLLTPRELEVLELMAQGYRNRDIANAFVISESTVKIHVRHVFEKLGVRTRTQAVARYQATSG